MSRSYAKINLALNVLNKNKPHELHELDMINVPIDLYDTIKVKINNDSKNEIIIECNDENVPTDNKNLIYQVIEKFKKNFNLNFSCKVYVNKNIPMFSGLGGGSSNAATMLNILNKKFKTNMTDLQKRYFLQSLTSDGPYMLSYNHARVKGNGEKITFINSKFKGKMFIVKPKKGCSSKQVYSNLDYKNLLHPNINKIEEAMKNNNYSAISLFIGNSLKDSACKINSEIQDVLNRFKVCGFEIISMSGSGSTCFAMSKKKLPYIYAKKIFIDKNYDLCKICKIK